MVVIYKLPIFDLTNRKEIKTMNSLNLNPNFNLPKSVLLVGMKNKCACPDCSNELQDSAFNTVQSANLGRTDVECTVCGFMGFRIGYQVKPIQ